MAVPDLPTAYKAVEMLQSYTPGCVVLTLGEKGVLFTEKGKPNLVRHQEAEKVKVVDTTVSIWSISTVSVSFNVVRFNISKDHAAPLTSWKKVQILVGVQGPGCYTFNVLYLLGVGRQSPLIPLITN